jgi:hypothetical protein
MKVGNDDQSPFSTNPEHLLNGFVDIFYMVERMISKDSVEAVIFEWHIFSFGPPDLERTFQLKLFCFFSAFMNRPGGVIYSCNIKAAPGKKQGHASTIAHPDI